jgi:hypothetical protein
VTGERRQALRSSWYDELGGTVVRRLIRITVALFLLGAEARAQPATKPEGCHHTSWGGPIFPGCPSVAQLVKKVTASSHSAEAHLAIDGDSCTAWQPAAGPPQSVTLDFGGPESGTLEPPTIGRIALQPAMEGGGAVAILIEVSSDGKHFEVRTRYDGTMQNGVQYQPDLAPAATARFLRIRVLSAPGRIGWMEIQPATCEGRKGTPPAPDSRAKTSGPLAGRPNAKVTPGAGACRRDEDCHGDTPCFPTSCTSAGHLPRGGACPQSCSGPMACGKGGCFCNEGRCAMWTVSPSRQP